VITLLNLLGESLDLDADWVRRTEFIPIADGDFHALPEVEEEPSADQVRAWFAALLKFAVDAEATAIRLSPDRSAMHLRQWVHMRSGAPGEEPRWVELVPMPWSRRSAGIRGVRFMACMILGRRSGSIDFKHHGVDRKATCVQESPDDLLVYLRCRSPALELPVRGCEW
jgi:hypothetical protein